MRIKIQSFSDVITNSSSELFVINTDLSKWKVQEIWYKILKSHGYDMDDSSYTGYTYADGKKIHISFVGMCNVGSDARRSLEEVFGIDNISYED